MIYPDVDGYYPYYMYDRETLPQCIITNTTSPKEYGQKLLNQKKSKRKWNKLSQLMAASRKDAIKKYKHQKK